MKSLFIAATLVALLVCSQGMDATAKSPPRTKVTGIYSDMRAQPQTGDLLGVEVFIVLSQSGYQVVFQDAEGSPSVPIVVPASIDNGHIEFELPERRGYSGKFEGKITSYGITGGFSNGQLSNLGKSTFILRKGKSHWQ